LNLCGFLPRQLSLPGIVGVVRVSTRRLLIVLEGFEDHCGLEGTVLALLFPLFLLIGLREQLKQRDEVAAPVEVLGVLLRDSFTGPLLLVDVSEHAGHEVRNDKSMIFFGGALRQVLLEHLGILQLFREECFL